MVSSQTSRPKTVVKIEWDDLRQFAQQYQYTFNETLGGMTCGISPPAKVIESRVSAYAKLWVPEFSIGSRAFARGVARTGFEPVSPP